MDSSGDTRIEIVEGFYLSRIRRSDKPAYLEHFTDPEIAANTLHIPFPYTEADADAWLDQCEKRAPEPPTRFAIREPGGYLIGGIGFADDWQHADRATFGYWLAKPFRGRGIMPATIRALANYAFQELGRRRLCAESFSSNLSSQRALEKAGFQRETVLKNHVLKNGMYLDSIVYGCVLPLPAGS